MANAPQEREQLAQVDHNGAGIGCYIVRDGYIA